MGDIFCMGDRSKELLSDQGLVELNTAVDRQSSGHSVDIRAKKGNNAEGIGQPLCSANSTNRPLVLSLGGKEKSSGRNASS